MFRRSISTGATIRQRKRDLLQTYFYPVLKILPGKRRACFFLIGMIAITIAAYFNYIRPNTYIPLFSERLPGHEIVDIVIILTKNNIEYLVSPDCSSIKVRRKYRDRAIKELLIYWNSVHSDVLWEHALPRSDDKIRRIERELQGSIREIEAIEEAYVDISPDEDERDYFSSWETTAVVMVRLKPGSELSKRDISGISHLAEVLVEGLKPENVTLIMDRGSLVYGRWIYDESCSEDTHPRPLTAKQERNGYFIENAMQKKAQNLLDIVLGEGRCKVMVDAFVEYYDESEEIRSSPQGNDSAMKVAYAKLETISVVLMVKDFTRDQIDKIVEILKENIGYDQFRGDFFRVITVPSQFDLREDGLIVQAPGVESNGTHEKSRIKTRVYSNFDAHSGEYEFHCVLDFSHPNRFGVHAGAFLVIAFCALAVVRRTRKIKHKKYEAYTRT